MRVRRGLRVQRLVLAKTAAGTGVDAGFRRWNRRRWRPSVAGGGWLRLWVGYLYVADSDYEVLGDRLVVLVAADAGHFCQVVRVPRMPR